jgi:hypothetical protein
MQLQHIAFEKLKISPVNMRHGRKAPDISDILPSVKARGKTVEHIANTFGITDVLVKRRLALGNLHSRIRHAYRNEAIDAETIRHLALASGAAILCRSASARGRPAGPARPSGAALRIMVAHVIGGSGLWSVKAEPRQAKSCEVTSEP